MILSWLRGLFLDEEEEEQRDTTSSHDLNRIPTTRFSQNHATHFAMRDMVGRSVKSALGKHDVSDRSGDINYSITVHTNPSQSPVATIKLHAMVDGRMVGEKMIHYQDKNPNARKTLHRSVERFVENVLMEESDKISHRKYSVYFKKNPGKICAACKKCNATYEDPFIIDTNAFKEHGAIADVATLYAFGKAKQACECGSKDLSKTRINSNYGSVR